MINTGNGKSLYYFVICSLQPTICMFEINTDLITFHLIRIIHWTGIWYFLTISLCPRSQCQTSADFLLIFRMNIKSITYINCHSHSCICKMQCSCLSFSQFSPSCIHWSCLLSCETCQLHHVKWKVISPTIPPVFYH